MPSSRSSGHRSLAGALLAAFLLIESLAIRTPAQAEDRKLLLAVELNGQPVDAMVEASDHDGALELAVDDLRAVGLRGPATQAAGVPSQVSLRELPGVTYRIDERRQVLLIEAADRSLLAQQLAPESGSGSLDVPAAGTGAVLNYNVLGTAGRVGGLNGLFDARVHSPYGVISSSFLAQQGFNDGVQGRHIVRLDTVLAQAELDGMRRWRLGDIVTGGLAWTRPFRMGGGQVTSDFSIRPDLVTFPLPDLSGRAGVPSTVDVLVNGVRQLSQQVQPGPFELRQPPVVTGAGDIAVVVRDVTGRETVRNLSFYASPMLLKSGLSSYSLEGGLVRTGYGLISDGYQQPAMTGTLRHGLSDWLTVEAHAEGSGQVQMGGAGVVVDLAGYGLVSASVAASRSARGTGVQSSVGFERSGRVLSVSGSISRASSGFRDVPSASGDPVPTSSARAGLGLSLGRWGSVHGAYVAVTGGLLPTQTGQLLQQLAVGRARVLSATYSRPINDTMSFYATGYRDFAQRNTMGINFGISMTLGERRSASASGALTDGQPAGYLNAVQTATVPGDIGWRASASQAQTQQQLLEGAYIMPWGTATVGGEHASRSFNGRAGLQGSLVLAGRDVFAANRVEDSFAVVDTQGLSDVTVLRENRAVGRTNASGRLLIPDLRGWEANRISIDPSGMPGDVELGSLHQVVRPRDHTGIDVRFTVKRSASAVVQLVDPKGNPLPPGSTAILARTGRKAPIGHGGEVFLNELTGEETLQVSTATGRCDATFRFTPVAGDIPVIGPVTCARATP